MSWHSRSPHARRRGRLAALLLAAPLLLAVSFSTKGVPNEALIHAAQAAPVRAIDYDQDRCDPRTVQDWLKALTAQEARAIRWSAGKCRLVGPGIDSGSDWCAQATVLLRRPQSRRDRPMVEIFLEAPKSGSPGPAYAFRGAIATADGDDMLRFRQEFEAAWISRFPSGKPAIVDCEGA
jgi:hypothetical protein